MKQDNEWNRKNFLMGDELDICGNLIYDLRTHSFLALKNKSNSEAFRFFYNLSISIERLLKIIIYLRDGKLTERDRNNNVDGNMHHTIGKLLNEVKIAFNNQQSKKIVNYLTSNKYYDNYRYVNFEIDGRERPKIYLNHLIDLLNTFLPKENKISESWDSLTHSFYDKARNYADQLQNGILGISKTLYAEIDKLSNENNLFINEFSHNEKASSVFQDYLIENSENGLTDEFLKQELIIFLMKNSIKNDRWETEVISNEEYTPSLDIDEAFFQDAIKTIMGSGESLEYFGIRETIEELIHIKLSEEIEKMNLSIEWTDERYEKEFKKRIKAFINERNNLFHSLTHTRLHEDDEV